MQETEEQVQSLSRDLLEILRCTACHAPLEQRANKEYRCTVCAREFPVLRGVARFAETESYANSFGYQWQKYAKTQLDHAGKDLSEPDFRRKTGLRPEDLKGKLVLDVGCGMGRFAEVATRWGARVVGIDLSAAAEVAARNLAG